MTSTTPDAPSARDAASPRRAGPFVREGRYLVLRPLSGNTVRLLLTSGTILFVELVLIR
jgi:hypothetical protein